MSLYHKIKTVHLRDNETHKLTDKFRNKTVELLKDVEWIFTEKIDGTNIRVMWDGYEFSFGGRTDRAQIPKDLLKRLKELFNNDDMEQMFEQKFGLKKVTLFGEGYGEKIQNGGDYTIRETKQDFIVFDITVNDTFLNRFDVNLISENLGLYSVPIVFGLETINDAVKFVKKNPKSLLGEKKQMEGVVGTPFYNVYDSNGDRVIVKIKCKDYKESNNG